MYFFLLFEIINNVRCLFFAVIAKNLVLEHAQKEAEYAQQKMLSPVLEILNNPLVPLFVY